MPEGNIIIPTDERDKARRAYARQLLAEEGYDPDDPDALQLTLEVITELEAEGVSATLDQIYDVDFIQRPPTMEEFLNDEYYLGDVCKADPQSGTHGLFPKWREVLMRDFGPNSNVQQLVLSGAIGLGKSWVASVVLLYKLAFAICLRDPVRYYGLSASSAITYSFFSVTQEQVKAGTFADCLRFLRGSPFFRERVNTKLDRKFTDLRIELSNNLQIEAGSRVHEALGRNVLVSCVDEVNFRLEKEAQKAAHELIEAIQRRIMSRFRRGDSHPGLLILMSSAQTADDFLVDYIRKYRNDPTVRVYDFPWWDVKGPLVIEHVDENGHKQKGYSGKKFTVDIGDALTAPRIIDDPEEAKGVPPSRLCHPPVEHREEFERDLTGSIRDLAGIATGRVSKLFPSALPIINSISDDTSNPFNTHSVPLSTQVNGPAVWEYLEPKRLLAWRDSRPYPKRHAAAPRFIHLDMSSGAQDAMGFAMVHPVGFTELTEFDKLTRVARQAMRPVFELDMAVRIVRDPRQSKPIDFGRVREFIWWLRRHNFRIEMVSCDLDAMSVETRAILGSYGFNTAYLSVDRKKDPYLQLRQTFDEGRMLLYQHDYLITELEHLEDGPDKIDHPDQFIFTTIDGVQHMNLKGSKDLSDALCGAVHMASQSEATAKYGCSPKDRASVLKMLTKKSQAPAEAWLARDALQDRVRTM